MLLNKTVLLKCQLRFKKHFLMLLYIQQGRTKHISVDMSIEIIMGVGKETK